MIGCVYRHPSGDRDLFSETLKSQLERLNNKGYEIVVLGDININFLNYNNDNHTSDFLDMLLDLGFMPLITKDHTSTLIDHIYTIMPGKPITAGICLADVSDHLPIFCTIANKLSASTEIKYYRDYSKFDNEAFLNSLASIDFRSLVTCDVNASMNRVTQILQQISDKHAPVRRASKQRRKQLNKPWISNAILISIKKKQKRFMTHFLSNNQEKVRKYKVYNNKLNKIKELAKKTYLRTHFDLHKNNLKTTWKLIGMLINNSICTQEVYDAITNINLQKSTIGSPQQCIKLARNYISEVLTIIFNESLLQGIVPDVLKVSKVTPVDKGGEVTDPSNFRPISTLSALTQIFEKLVYKQLINYIEKHDILFQFQFGFRKGHSTAQAVSEIADNLREAIDNNLYTCGVFIDFSKAFDTVNHEILLKKLESYGIRGMSLKWFTSYLNNRQQYVAIGHTESPRQVMTCGIPQGSTLGPLLFLLLIYQ